MERIENEEKNRGKNKDKIQQTGRCAFGAWSAGTCRVWKLCGIY